MPQREENQNLYVNYLAELWIRAHRAELKEPSSNMVAGKLQSCTDVSAAAGCSRDRGSSLKSLGWRISNSQLKLSDGGSTVI